VAGFPPVPLTLEGSFVLHQFFHFDWKAWRRLTPPERERVAGQAVTALHRLERESPNTSIRTALYSQLGHKGDLILIHFRPTLEALNQVELDLAQTELYDFFELRHSYISVVELGLYESTRKTYEAAAEKGRAEFTPEWNAEIIATLDRQIDAMAPRLHPAIPERRVLSDVNHFSHAHQRHQVADSLAIVGGLPKQTADVVSLSGAAAGSVHFDQPCSIPHQLHSFCQG